MTWGAVFDPRAKAGVYIVTDRDVTPTEISQAFRRVAAAIDRGEGCGDVLALDGERIGSWAVYPRLRAALDALRDKVDALEDTGPTEDQEAREPDGD